MNAFTQGVSNVMQVTLSPRIDKLVQGLSTCLATLTKPGAGENRMSVLQKETILKEIRDVGITAKDVYYCSKSFLAHCDI